MELRRCYWELPGLAKRDGWATLKTAGASAGEVPPVIDEPTQRPLLHGSNWCTLGPRKPTILSLRTLPEEKKGGKVEEQTLCKVSRCWKATLWACRVNRRVLCSSGQWKVPQQPSNQDRGLIKALVGSGVFWRALTGAVSRCPQLEASRFSSWEQFISTELSSLVIPRSTCLKWKTSLFSVPHRSPATCPLSARPSCGTEDSVGTQ